MDFMRKIPERYQGLVYFLLGGVCLFIARQVSSLGGVPAASSSPESVPRIPFFIVGMAVPALPFFILKRTSSSTQEESKLQTSNLSGDYAGLEEQTRGAWILVSKNNRLYLGSLIVSLGANIFGDLSGHPVFGNPLVIAFVYTLTFFACIQQLANGRKLEDQIADYSMQGIQLEKRLSKTGYFHEIARAPQGFEIFMLIFFRIVIPVWMLYRAIDLSVKEQVSQLLPPSVVILGMFLALGLVAFLLWNFGCRPSILLQRRMKESIA